MSSIIQTAAVVTNTPVTFTTTINATAANLLTTATPITLTITAAATMNYIAMRDIWTGWIETTTHSATTWNVWMERCRHEAIRAAEQTWGNWTDPQRAALRAFAEEERHIYEEAARTFGRVNERLKAEADAANRKAEDLLRANLTPEQLEDLEKKKCFYLSTISPDGSRRRYRIDRGTHGNVKLLDEKGSILGSYCAQPDSVPVADSMLAQKLWIEGAEAEFLRIANFRAAGR